MRALCLQGTSHHLLMPRACGDDAIAVHNKSWCMQFTASFLIC